MLENQMLQFLNSDFQQFTQLDKQDKQDENTETEVPNTSQRQLRVKSFEEKPANKPLNLIFQMLLQKKTQKRQQIKVDPKSIPLSINLSIQVQELPIIRKIMEKNEWKKAHNFDGDILWCGPDNVQQAKQFTYDFAMVFMNLCISRIPGAKLISTKKETTSIMAKMRQYNMCHIILDIFRLFIIFIQKPTPCQRIYMNSLRILKKRMASPTQLNPIRELRVKESSQSAKQKIYSTMVSRMSPIQRKTILYKSIQAIPYYWMTRNSIFDSYINEEGLARLCTENYQDITSSNLSNVYMHLTNYSLNKNSQNFIIHPPDFQKMNLGTKRTYTSAKKTLMKMGIDVPKLKLRIEQTIVRFLYGIAPFLLNSTREVYQDKWEKANCFHVIGFDILIDKDLKPWIIEINANPSLEITQVVQNANGSKRVETSSLDAFVKTKVIEDAFIIAVKTPQEQIEQIGKGKYCNSYKMIIDGQPPIENLDLFYKLVDLYSNLCGLRYGNLNQMRFCRLANNPQLINELLIKSDYDLIYKKIQLKSLQTDLNFLGFIEAIESISEKLLKRKASNYTLQKAVTYVVNMALKAPQSQQRPLTAKR
ncbi:unnamed protein product (macronuclear) [Paramecium tetraurelia]|uniref:Tubulin-tyrosine ligase family protein n=1 Tax=Paramecium tetraurelia TaxID=5888 RepID=A0CNI9_PARTE|nr:uncharacterized protein GSPATT00008798001 [Paramecium tetraurelia]CAK72356.1 unnamed protein product [Paramecium tetraurelia]|eukprot:XP_001439753.1 hypothetical protein (macronuclear) [Paramecium tetraurelia strain d4-2]